MISFRFDQPLEQLALELRHFICDYRFVVDIMKNTDQDQPKEEAHVQSLGRPWLQHICAHSPWQQGLTMWN